MKEATGSANITVIAIILIGVVGAVGFMLVPRLTGNITEKGCCTKSGGEWSSGMCSSISGIEFNQDEYNDCISS